ncbi:extracellular solute-binding protein [Microbacterium sp. zg.Y1090]|uniref:extracellular solute-binding protein n=1 Tax=Microbacterium TaxID=33882 RepID=UPI00214A99CE|nr:MULTISPECIES: extracellular solute-binding protein [unclassified Microbacterium]MCR2812409.1 extracellular solute-binding protein [Microbacterium sp. zg.Y1084]MCR2817790.1 extracellular solute-binding protein [Microbacterium sp. zg.Y1090]MDL5485566.1 extracellular solute-binding protein [Microbacterium sp. zg-Y1211]WIM28737.1 extracellular solute-binding protein [Microbacterium sp. zg-Y1090]
MNRRKLALPIAAVGTLALLMSGCTSGGSGESSGDPNAEFEFWSFTGIGQKDSVERYLEKNPDAKVKLSEVGSTAETATALTAALAGGRVPDLVMIQNDELPKFIENPSNFIDLRTLGGDDLGEDYLDWAIGEATAEDGSIIGIPTDVGGLGFAYRADLFEAAGLPSDPDEVAAMWSDWDSFIEMGEKYTAATGQPFVDNVETTVFFAAVNQVSEKYYSPEGEVTFDTNGEVEEAFDVAVRAYEAGISAGIAAWSSGWAPGRANAAFAVSTAPSWMLSGYKTDAPDTEGLWRVAAVPGVGGNWGGSVIAIPARAKNPEAAWQYIQTMLTPEAQTEHFAETGTFPAAKSALESEEVLSYTDPFYGDSQIGEVISESVLQFNSFLNGPDTSAIGAALLNTLVDMEAGNVAPREAWSTGVSSAKAALGG